MVCCLKLQSGQSIEIFELFMSDEKLRDKEMSSRYRGDGDFKKRGMCRKQMHRRIVGEGGGINKQEVTTLGRKVSLPAYRKPFSSKSIFEGRNHMIIH